MTLGDFTTLFQGWLNRSDCTSDLATTFINRGIGRIQRECRLPIMENTYTPALDGADGITWQNVAIPNDFIALKDVLADDVVCYPTTLGRLMQAPAASGTPHWFTRVGSVWQFRPYPSQYVKIIYYGQFAPLVNPTDTNMLLTVAPEVLLWASLAYGADYFRMDDKAGWESQYEGERDALVMQGQDADFFNSPQAVEPCQGVSDYL